MSIETWIDVLVVLAAVPATLFVILYPILARTFWRTWIGRALFTSSAGLASLLDISLVFKWFGWLLPRPVILVILCLIAAGAWLKFTALVVTRRQYHDEH